MDTKNESCEPMDIDLSTNSLMPMDISSNQDTEFENGTSVVVLASMDNSQNNLKETKNRIKKFRLNVPVGTRKKKSTWRKITISFFLVIFLALTLQRFLSTQCMEQLNLTSLKEIMSSKLYGQDSAIENIIKFLDSKEKSKMLIFYGGTGVGKTYAVSLILDKLWDYVNIYHYTATSFMINFTPHLLIGMTFCKSSIFIVDNLSHNDMEIKDTIADVIKKSENLKKNITVILVYNCDVMEGNFIKKCDNHFYENLENNFKTIKAKTFYIPFKTLQEEQLKKCIENELGNRKLTDQIFYNIKKNFNVTVDGCKGVHPKMKILNLL